MKHHLSKITPLETAKSLHAAETQLERPEVTNGSPVYVQVRPQDIRERLELFQPRRPGWGTRTLDTDYVNKLKTRITRKGELDPVLVVKLGNDWIVVDGHHRLAAYQKLKRTEPIRCEWFAGTVREAMDASLSRNEKIHLEVDQGDKAEAAWTRTLLDWSGSGWSSSKADVVTLTGCGEGSVAQMRRAVKWHHNQRTGKERTPTGEKLYVRLGPDLRVHPWNKVKSVLNDITPKEWDLNEAAAKLARNLVMRMTTKLSEDPEVTAQALWLYNRDQYPKLVEAMQAYLRGQQEAERAEEDEAAYERLEAGE
ncbi:ParB/RepB/Spo0J family partition protein [Bradyrhizobium vignae]|uniref:ParB-like nuclease domain-containing protein n=1 Tax=Bradyrhizobium vignae TaxID=1549949 RepID=A0ABS3ZT54_9BRAD|nr:ParB/RepB/Spo0J family partition protein [Bradyrhizobium vignae]MBP0111339.1 ParB-like nuclease domain-containing protein [Bradyrhizobium vignae]